MDTFPDILDTDATGIPEPDGHIPQAYRDVQHTLDRFVEVGYEAAVDAHYQTTQGNIADPTYQKQQILDLLAANPPLLSVPRYYAYEEDHENYLWYSDFYDKATKECFKQYGKFIPMGATITPANYAQELVKVDLPYFKELVKLVCLMKLVSYIEARQPRKAAPAPAPIPTPATAPPSAEESTPNKIAAAPIKVLRSYEPKLTQAQYILLSKCLNRFEVFRSNITATMLRELLEGKKSHLLQVTNQRTLTYILDELAKDGLIRKAWIAVAAHNGNFISGPRRGVEDTAKPHYITAQQFSNCRLSNQYKFVENMDDIDEAIEQIVDK